MKAKLRGLRHISSAMKHRLVSMPERVCAQSESDILSELARLGKEKQRLDEERENWQERVWSIDARLKDVNKLEEWLQQRMEQMAMKQEVDLDAQDAKWAGHEIVIKY